MFNFNLDTHSSKKPGQVKQNKQNLLYQISNFFLNHSKGDLYKVAQAIVWYMTKAKAKRISRKALAKFAKCHVDTVSAANMCLEEAGIFQIGRRFKQNNVYESNELLEALQYFFGYSVNYLLSSASLLNLTDNINITIDLKHRPFWYAKTKENDQKGEIQANLATCSQIASESLRNSIPVLCPEAATLQDISFWDTEISDAERAVMQAEIRSAFKL